MTRLRRRKRARARGRDRFLQAQQLSTRPGMAYGQNVQSEQRGGRDEEQIVREFAESLPDLDRSIFTLYLTNLNYQEIAEVSGISDATLRIKISRLKNRFEQRYL